MKKTLATILGMAAMYNSLFSAPKPSAGLDPECRENLKRRAEEKRRGEKLQTFTIKGYSVQAKSRKDAIKILKHKGLLK